MAFEPATRYVNKAATATKAPVINGMNPVAHSINQDVERVITLLDNDAVSGVDRHRLIQYLGAVSKAEVEQQVKIAVSKATPKPDDEDVKSFNLFDEMTEQLKFLRAIKQEVMHGDGSLSVPVKEATTILTTTDRVINTIAKLSDQMKTHQRLKHIEETTIELVRLLPPEHQAWFFDTFQKKMDGVS